MFLEEELLRCVLQRYLSRAARREGPQCSQSLARAGDVAVLGKLAPGLRLGGGRCPVSSTGTVLGARIGLSACFMSVSFNMEMLPPDRRDASHGRGPCNTASCQGESSSFCNQGGGLSSFAFPPRFPSTFFFFASDPSSMTS